MIGAPAHLEPEAAAVHLFQRFGCPVVITLGSDGATVCLEQRVERVSALPADSVDPTGAGDAFCAAFTVQMAAGAELRDALHFANAAGACAVTVAGAEPSMPTRIAVEERLSATPSR
jgi:ribokinase